MSITWTGLALFVICAWTHMFAPVYAVGVLLLASCGIVNWPAYGYNIMGAGLAWLGSHLLLYN
jgi:hypothetical protein